MKNIILFISILTFIISCKPSNRQYFLNIPAPDNFAIITKDNTKQIIEKNNPKYDLLKKIIDISDNGYEITVRRDNIKENVEYNYSLELNYSVLKKTKFKSISELIQKGNRISVEKYKKKIKFDFSKIIIILDDKNLVGYITFYNNDNELNEKIVKYNLLNPYQLELFRELGLFNE